MRAIVTGAAGFIGSHVAENLLRRGWAVLGIDDLSGGFEANLPAGIDFRRLSITVPLDDAFGSFRPDFVYHLAAYAAEIVRAGIESVRPGQTRAALALGMSQAQVLRRIVLPQALVRMLPAFGSLLSVTIKDTAIASVIAVPELMRQSETVAGQSFQPIEVYSFAMLVYFVLLFPVTRGVDRLYRRVAHLGQS